MTNPVPCHRDPSDPLNGPQYHSGKPCIEDGCDEPAGTVWAPFWCQKCNAARMERISAALDDEIAFREGHKTN